MLLSFLVFLLLFNYSQIFSIDSERSASPPIPTPAAAPAPITTTVPAAASAPGLTIVIPVPTPRAPREPGHVHIDSPRPSLNPSTHVYEATCATCFAARYIMHAGSRITCQICSNCSPGTCDCLRTRRDTHDTHDTK